MIILSLGLLAALAGYWTLYFLGTDKPHHSLRSQNPELAWLREEFRLSDTELKRIAELHASYRPHCAAMCQRIDQKNAELRMLLNATNTLTADIEEKLSEAAQLRVECEKAMLKHFFEVARTMPPKQGQRYLAWVQERTFLASHNEMHESH